MRSILQTPITAALFGAFFVACGAKTESKADKSSGPLVVRTHVLAPRPLDNVINTTGTLLANESVEIRSEVSGRVAEIGFKEGSNVAAGQVLLRINNDDVQAQLRKMELAVELASQDESRKKQLLAVSGISQQAYDDARIQLQSAQADRDNLKAMLAKTTIRAPFGGRIGLRQISEGGFVSSNTLIAQLQQVSPIKLEFSVPERYGRGMTEGKNITFTLENDSTTYAGTVYAVEPAVDVASRSIRVRAHYPNEKGRLMPGAFAKVRVELDRADSALTIPTEALIPDIQGQKVLVIRHGKATSVRVELGIRTEHDIQLISGVQAGDTVITTGLMQLREGMRVQAAKADNVNEEAEADSAAAADPD